MLLTRKETIATETEEDRSPTAAEEIDASKRLLTEVNYIGVGKSKNDGGAKVQKPLEEAFGIMERIMVDLKFVKGSCANGIPFYVLQNPHFIELVSAIKNATDGYKPPASEKAQTVLLDECFRDVEKEITLFEDIWLSQGLSIISDGLSNVKHNPLITVLAVNSRETVGASNVLQVVTNNAPNCKVVGKEIEKFCDGEGPNKMGEVYEKMDNVLREIKDVMKDNQYFDYYDRIENIVLERWEKMSIPLHCLGFALNLQFYDKHYLEKLAPGGIPWKAPNKEVVKGCNASV
ncbi:hypothetical protein OSB04_016659 [Centaurea solstitialis]|uniref:Uncharacterized protein n=1 Tax=Centaurea solstitialis TaxID=347529 RepID=A0AA38T1E0_9ASTR|nr:hypothetical protein OSB04_016659 [Centaurea solstitialis]